MITIALCAAFGGVSAIMFIYGKRFYDSDWLISCYAVFTTSFIMGLLMVLFQQTTFKLMQKYREKHEQDVVVPEYMGRHFVMKFRWWLMGIGLGVVGLLALLCVVL